MGSEKPIRVQLYVSRKMYEAIDQVKDKTGATSRGEVLRNALSLYAAILAEEPTSNTIELLSKDGCRVKMVVPI